MATSVVFDLIGALVDTFTTALGSTARVFDGALPTEDAPTSFVMVGIGDPYNTSPDTAADSTQTWAGLGAHARDEQGTITCCAVSWNGDGAGLAAARAGVKAITETIAATLKASPNLNNTVPGLLWTGMGSRGTWTPIQAEDGSSLVHYFEIQFRARLT
jgi:hypothetical protein